MTSKEIQTSTETCITFVVIQISVARKTLFMGDFLSDGNGIHVHVYVLEKSYFKFHSQQYMGVK